MNKIATMLNDNGIVYLHWAAGPNAYETKTIPYNGKNITGRSFVASPEHVEYLLLTAGLELIKPIEITKGNAEKERVILSFSLKLKLFLQLPS
jgi:hypothetical protein